MSDEVALEAALIAHLLNEGITAIEQTESILSLLSLRLKFTIEDIKTGLYQIKNSKARESENSRILTPAQVEIVDSVLNEFGMKLSSFVSNRLPMLNLAPNILAAVREGKLSPTAAVLLNRQPEEMHEELVLLAEGLTKHGVLNLVREHSQTDQLPESSQNELSTIESVFSRLKAVKRNKSLVTSPKGKRYISQIEKLISKLESLGG